MVSQKKGGVKFEDPSLDINDDYDPDQNPEEKRKLRAALRAQDVAVSGRWDTKALYRWWRPLTLNYPVYFQRLGKGPRQGQY